jgi:hypothetical protein
MGSNSLNYSFRGISANEYVGPGQAGGRLAGGSLDFQKKMLSRVGFKYFGGIVGLEGLGISAGVLLSRQRAECPKI